MNKFRIYQGIEYYGRDINHINDYVLFCSICGYIGTYSSLEEVEEAKRNHVCTE